MKDSNSSMRIDSNWIKAFPVTVMVVLAGVLLFICSSLKHWLLHSSAWDLGIFDQAIYLISGGKIPNSSFLGGLQILGDHASVIFYPLAVFYWLYPNVYWLLAIQSFCLSISGFLVFYLGLQAGLDKKLAIAVVLAYLLYPLIINISLFDFHPEVIAIPAFFAAIIAARSRKIVWFCVAIAIILSCKEVLALTVVAMGIWLIFFERRAICGAVAICTGSMWFIIATKLIIPSFSGTEPASISRYSYLGNSILEIVVNIFLKPSAIFSKILSGDTLEYCALLLLPIAWGLSLKYLAPLISTVPMFFMNILSMDSGQRSMVFQYSLPIVPFLIITALDNLAANHSFIKTRKSIVIWSLILFILLGKIGYLWSKCLDSLDTRQAMVTAISKIQDSGGVLTTNEIAPHLSHRSLVKLTFKENVSIDLKPFKYILLNERHPGWNSDIETVRQIRSRAESSQIFSPDYKQDDVYLYVAKSS